MARVLGLHSSDLSAHVWRIKNGVGAALFIVGASEDFQADSRRPIFGIREPDVAQIPPPHTVEHVAAECIHAIRRLQPEGPYALGATNTRRDVALEMTRLTLAIVGPTLFDADVEAEADEIGAALTTALGLFGRSVALPYFEILDRLPLPSNRRFVRAKARIDATIARLIAERRGAPAGRSDLLSLLLAARDTEGDGRGVTDAQVRDEAITIFLAGHETTANALAWTWYLLAKNPDAEAKLHAELDAVLDDRPPAVADLPRLRYAEMVLAESMRLYPPAWIVGRRALEPYAIGGYAVPKRSIVVACQWVTHRDPRYFPDPERFDPERWTPEAKEARPKFSYFPFGGGPRVCIGEGFAWMEGVLVLAAIARRWRLRLAEDRLVVPAPSITLRPKGGIRMRLVARRETP